MGKFRQRKYIEARKTLKGLMQVRGMHAVVAAGACAAGSSTAAGTLHVAPLCPLLCPLPHGLSSLFIPSAPVLQPATCLQVHPEFRQAETLLEACEHEIVKDGLVGVGAGAAIAAVAAIAIAALSRR